MNVRNFLLSAVILTKNEELNIRACLESVYGWADEIIVVDDESSDGTLTIVREYTQNVYSQRMDNEGRQRNWSFTKARGDWILSLDADERVSAELKLEIDRVLMETGFQAFTIPFRNYIGDYWVKYCDWYPASKLRLFKRGCCQFEEAEVHPRVYVQGETAHLTKDIVHRGHRDFGHFLEKVNRQTTREAQKWIRTGQNMPKGRIIRRALDRFFRSYVVKKGYKDGIVGFMVAYFASLYQIMSYAKYWEMKRRLPGANAHLVQENMEAMH